MTFLIRVFITIAFLFVLIGSLVTIAKTVFAADTLQATITWKNTDLSRKIQVEKSPTSTGNYTVLAQLDPGSVSYVDATNAPGERWCYRTAYFDSVKVYSYSSPRCKTFSITVSAPSTVTVK